MVFSSNQKAERKESKAGMIGALGLSVGWKLFFSVRNVDQVSLLSHCERTLACCVVCAGGKCFPQLKNYIYLLCRCVYILQLFHDMGVKVRRQLSGINSFLCHMAHVGESNSDHQA